MNPYTTPNRVQVAFNVVQFMDGREQRVSQNPFNGEVKVEPPTPLSAPEQALKNAALETLRNYVSGELTLPDQQIRSVATAAIKGDDEQGATVPLPIS